MNFLRRSFFVKYHALLLLLVIFSSCTFRSPILLYKDQKIDDSEKIPLRAGLMISALQGFQGVNIKSSQWMIIIPVYHYRGEFPKGKEGEFLADMVRQYFLDSSIFSYVYNAPFKNQDVDIVLNLKLHKFVLKNSKGWVTFRNLLQLVGYGASVLGTFMAVSDSSNSDSYYYDPYYGYSYSSSSGSNTLGSILALSGAAVPLLQLILPQEKFSTEYDIEIEILLPNGEKIATFRKTGAGKDSVGIFGQPYGEYIYYRSVFKKVFLGLMDQLRDDIKENRNVIITKYKEWLVSE